MRLTRVTFTGADDSTEPSELLRISQKHPWVEWGILISKQQTGSFRFPSERWLARLFEIAKGNPQINFCAHVCGRWVRQLLAGDPSEFKGARWDLMQLARRVQLNFHAEPHEIVWTAFPNVCIGTFAGRQIILQMDGTHNEEIFSQAIRLGLDCAPLFDVSGGAGVAPNEWPLASSLRFPGFIGYAGGLGPETINTELPRIAVAAGDSRIWIDMERRVRSEDDSKFDLNKVRAVIKAVSPYVVRYW